jgi:DNA polymerase-1
MLALIDGDYLTYARGFACEKTYYQIHESEEALLFGKLPLAEVRYKKEVFPLLKEGNIITKRKEVDSLQNCLHSVKVTLQSIIENTKSNQYRVFLTGGNQFREKIAKTQVYKGNRDKAHRPVYYQEIRDYMIKTWKAELIEYYEADDLMASTQWNAYVEGNLDTVICTIDKDLNQIPGWHYNISTQKLSFINPEEAETFLWMQVLMGDRVDNVQGIPFVGEAKARKILKDVPLSEMKQRVLDEYKKYFKDEEKALESFQEHFDLVAMKRYLDDEGIFKQ